MKIFTKKAFSLIELSIVIIVVGILIAGVTYGSNLIDKANVKAARSLTQSSPVQSIHGLSLWLDATSSDAFTDANISDGDSIAKWQDTNPHRSDDNRLHVVQTNNSYKPKYIENGINDLPAVLFDGSNDNLIKTNVPTESFMNYDEGTIFIVIKDEKQTVLAGTPLSFVNVTHTNSNHRRFLVHTPTPSAQKVYFDFGYYGSTGSLSYDTTDSSFFHKPLLLSAVHRENNYSEIRIDGAMESSRSSITATIPAHTDFKLTIGAYFNSDHLYKGLIGEIIVYDHALSNKDIVYVENYLLQKWGI